jgi:transposase-like protein
LVRRGAVLCALCHGQLKLHGCYPRCLKDEEGNREQGWVAQGHCESCGTYPALIPDLIMPYKHYSTEVIERVIAESEDGGNVEKLGGCAADVSTMRRWVRQFKERGARAAGWLLSVLLKLYERQISLLELQNKTILKQLARLLREFPTFKTGGIIGKVNTILTTQNCGFL